MMNNPKQSPIHYGFKDINGNEWSNSAVDSYNRYTLEINRTAGREIAPRSLTAQGRDFMLDQRHRYYVSVMYSF